MKQVTFVALSIFTAVLTSCGGGESTTPSTCDTCVVVTDTTKVSDSTAVTVDTTKVAADTAKAGK